MPLDPIPYSIVRTFDGGDTRLAGMPGVPADSSAMKNTQRRWGLSFAGRMVVCITLVVGLAASTATFVIMREWNESQFQVVFERESQRAISSVRLGIDFYLNMLRGLAAFHEASDEISRDEFRLFTTDYLERSRGIHSVQWLPLVSHGQRDQVENEIRKEGFPDFQFTQRDLNGKLVKADARSQYFPRIFVEPFVGNENTLGFDVGSEPLRLQGIERARDTGKLTASLPLKLTLEQRGEPGFVVFVPVYRQGYSPPTIKARRAHLAGIYSAVFRIPDLFNSILDDLKLSGINLTVFDQSEDGHGGLLFFRSFPQTEEKACAPQPLSDILNAIHYSEDLKIGDVRWFMAVTPTPSFKKGAVHFGPWIAFASGLFVTFLVALYLAGIHKSSDETKGHLVEQEIARKKLESEIVRREETERELRQRDLQQQALLDNIPAMAWLKDREGKYIAANEPLAKAVGLQLDEVVGKTDLDLWPADQAGQYYSLDMEVISRGVVKATEETLTDREGLVHWLETVKTPIYDHDGKITGTVGISWDITENRLSNKLLKESEQRFRSIFENRHIIMVICDPETGEIVDANPAALAFYGYTLDQLKDRTVFDLNPAPREIVKQNLQRANLQSQEYSGFRHILANGEEREVDVMPGPIVLGGKRLNLVVLKDVTERNRLEKTLRETELRLSEEKYKSEEHKLQTLIDGMEQGLLIVDDQSRITGVNRWFLERVSMERDTILNREISRNNFSHENIDDIKQVFCEYREGTRRTPFEINRGFMGMHATIRLQPIFHDGNYRGSIVNVIDVSVIEEARLAAEGASRLKSDFLANMSHEIRTPINGIMGMTELALNTTSPSEQREYLEDVMVASTALLTVVNDILDFSKIEAGKLELINVEFNVRKLIDDAAGILAVTAAKKGLELLSHVSPEMPPILMGDPGRLRQVLVNLLGNAVKFTDEGEVLLNVESEIQPDNRIVLRFSVKDTGIGIAPDKTDAIFRAFEQADGSMSRRYQGTGLGLSISKRICELMGGRLWMESTVGLGSTFHFEIILGVAPESEVRNNVQKSINWKDLRALVVDDNATNRKILEQLLKYWGMKPTVASSGPEALLIFDESRRRGQEFSLIITDSMMPEMDGFQFIEAIKRNPHYSAVTMMMLTSGGERGDAQRSMDLGIAAYLTKPLKQDELFMAITKALEASPDNSPGTSLITRHSIRESKKSLKILLAEDNPVNQKVAKKILEKMGHVVTIAGNGRKAVDTLAQENFDLILMDVSMPELTGIEATGIIRNQEKDTGDHIPIIAMTAHAIEGDREKCIEAGMDGYLSKPIKVDQLSQAIESMMQVVD